MQPNELRKFLYPKKVKTIRVRFDIANRRVKDRYFLLAILGGSDTNYQVCTWCFVKTSRFFLFFRRCNCFFAMNPL